MFKFFLSVCLVCLATTSVDARCRHRRVRCQPCKPVVVVKRDKCCCDNCKCKDCDCGAAKVKPKCVGGKCGVK